MSIMSVAFPPGTGTGIFNASQFALTALAGGPGEQLILWTDTEILTSFSPSCIEQLTRVETVFKHSHKLVEKIRQCAQPNPAYRGERLVPSDVNCVSERVQLVVGLRDAIICFDNMKPLSEYTNELIAVQDEVEKLHDTFLRRVALFSVKPIKKYLEEIYPAIKKMYTEMQRCRDKYDAFRAKLSKSDSTEILAKTELAQQEFADKANTLGAFFKEMPVHQMNLAKAVDDYARSEADFCTRAIKLLESVKPPESKKRWT